MSQTTSRSRWSRLLCPLLLFSATALSAQSSGLSVGGAIGLVQLDGHPRTVIIGARLIAPLSPIVFVDAGVSWFSEDPPTSLADTLPGHLLPEVGLGIRVPFGRLHPYAVSGVGMVADLRRGGDASLALHLAAGLQVDVWNGWAARLDLRIRSLASPHSDSREVTLGVTKRLRLPWSGPD
ncbi:MAG: outer membrane beta-barrel protein [Gemmatimonadales bacterium]